MHPLGREMKVTATYPDGTAWGRPQTPSMP